MAALRCGDFMISFNSNIEIFRDIATTIDIDEMVNMYMIYHWRVIDGHIQLQIRDPERPMYSITCEFEGDGIISFGTNNYFMDIKNFYYSQSVCRKEFKRILREMYDIKL